MFCPQCGSNQSDDLKFCKACGANLQAVRLAVAARESGLNFTVAEGMKDAAEKVVALAGLQQAAA